MIDISGENVVLVGALLLFVAVMAGKVAYRFGAPALLLFLGVGMLFGLNFISYRSVEMTQFVGMIALCIILFTGGMDTKFSEIKPIIGPGVVLATVGVVMTAFVALKYGNLSDLVTVPEEAVITESGSSMAGVVPGDQMSLEDLLYGLMIPSGNDAANAIAVHVGGSIEGFVSMMNQEAACLGATGTHFVNANGLTDPDHYTTAYDLYLMFYEALSYDTFRTIIGTHDHTAVYMGSDGSQKTASWTVGNYYMNGKAETPEGLAVFGGKTGTTKAAGYCLIMGTRTEDGREYASVIMGADSRAHLYEDMTNIISKIDK